MATSSHHRLLLQLSILLAFYAGATAAWEQQVRHSDTPRRPPGFSILVTGAAGFVGTHSSLALPERGDGVLGFDNFNSYYDPSLKRARRELLSPHQLFIVEGDLNDAQLLSKLFDIVPFTHILRFARVIRSRKRKQTEVQAQPSPPIKSTGEPFPNHPHPTPEDCRAVRDDLLALHGFPQEFAKYRSQRLNGSALIPAKPEPFDGEDDQSSSGSNERVLDGLVSTVLSQHTTDVNSHRAFASLTSAFPTWEDVLAAESKSVENAIRCGGLAPTQASCIKNVLSCLLEKKKRLVS